MNEIVALREEVSINSIVFRWAPIYSMWRCWFLNFIFVERNCIDNNIIEQRDRATLINTVRNYVFRY